MKKLYVIFSEASGVEKYLDGAKPLSSTSVYILINKILSSHGVGHTNDFVFHLKRCCLHVGFYYIRTIHLC